VVGAALGDRHQVVGLSFCTPLRPGSSVVSAAATYRDDECCDDEPVVVCLAGAAYLDA